MTLALESQVRRAEWMPLRLLRASVWALRDRREQRAAARALSAMDDHLLKDIGVSRLEIDFGRLQPSGRSMSPQTGPSPSPLF